MKSTNAFSKFESIMMTSGGRWIRVLAGLSMIGFGLKSRSNRGYAIAVAGLVPFAAGAFDFCALGPLAGDPIKGDDMRNVLKERRESTSARMH